MRSHALEPAEVGEHLGQRLAAVEVGVAVRAHDQEARVVGRRGDVAQHEQRRLRRPVQVVDHEQDRRGLGAGARARRQRPRTGGTATSRDRSEIGAGRSGHAVGEARHEPDELAGVAPERVARLASARSWSTTNASASTNGWYGTPSSSSQRPKSTVMPCACTRRASSADSRVLPMPGSPDEQHHRPLSRRPRGATAASSVSSSGWRPMNGNRAPGSSPAGKGSPPRSTRARGSHSTRTVGERLGQALELERADRRELVVGARAGDDAHDVGAEDLAALRLGAQAGRLDHRRAVEVVVLQAGVAQARARPARRSGSALALVPLVDRLLHRRPRTRCRRPRRGTRP